MTVYSLNSTAIQAEWNAPELIDQNGVLTSYQVRYNGSVLDTTERVLNLSINTMSVILTGLLPNVFYCVMILVENGAGLSEFSSPNCARTHEAGMVYACGIYTYNKSLNITYCIFCRYRFLFKFTMLECHDRLIYHRIGSKIKDFILYY